MITVSGKLQDSSGTAITSNAFVRFNMRYLGGNQPYVSGTALISPTGSTWYEDFAVDGSGNISGSLYSTSEVTVGGLTGVIAYGMVVYRNGQPGPESIVSAAGNISINNPNILSTQPVSVAPTGDTTYIRLDGSNSPATGVALVNSTSTGTDTGIETLTHKTLTSPVITGATIDSNVLAGTANRLAFKQAAARVTKSANQSLTSGVLTALTWDTETFDTDSLHSTVTNTSRLTASATGKWIVAACVQFAANATGSRLVFLQKNGTTTYNHDLTPADATNTTRTAVSDIIDLSAGDYVEAMAFQSSGGALNVVGGDNISSFSMVLVGQ